MRISDTVITVAYFSIPLQILFSLWRYPRLARMPTKVFVLGVLFAFFIFLCGAGHLLRCLDMTRTTAFEIINQATAVISAITALYLLPLMPMLLGSLDQSLEDLTTLSKETKESKDKLFTFMSFLCHELRNPLFALTASASFLGDTELTEEQEQGIGSIFDSSLLMLRLVNDVLDLSKIDAGKLELEERNFDVHRLLENLGNNMKMQIAQKHGDRVALNCHVANDVPRVLYGDSMRLLQVVYNLLSNSSKFTEEGSIDLTVSISERNADGKLIACCEKFENEANECAGSDTTGDTSDTAFSMALLQDDLESGLSVTMDDTENLCIIVSDTGVGIDESRIDKIFQPYCQAKLSDYRVHGGTGLGLSILSNIVKLMGGTINVSSELDKGTRFVVHLPVKVALDQSTDGLEDMDMSDPLLSCRRLPVYEKEESETDEELKEEKKRDEKATPRSRVLLKIPSNENLEGMSMKFIDDSKKNENHIEKCNTIHEVAEASTLDHMEAPLLLFDPIAATSAPVSAAPAPPPKQKKPILPIIEVPPSTFAVVVDDNKLNLKILGRMLSGFGIPFKQAMNGSEAVEVVTQLKAANSHIPLVFMDLSMPIKDGYEATAEIRANGWADIPIIALTANALEQERDRALAAGANEFKTKPILRPELHAICARYVAELT